MRDVSELTCREVVELVSEYLSGELDPEDRVRLEQHLFVCPPCTVYVGQMRSTLELAAELGEASAAGVDPVLLDLFRRWKQK